jgi:L-asparaginase II
MRMQLDVVVWRGPIAEARHRVQAVVSDARGVMSAGTSAPDTPTTFRSAAKPFQLLPLVERGHAANWGFRDEELAVMAASHTGSPYHIALVQGILGRIGLSHYHLACGYHDPLDHGSLTHLAAHPEERTALYNNCSGKHAGMLALALSEGWPIEGYERAEHPLQQLMRVTVAELCGLAPESLAVGVDGCSVSVFGAPLSAMARSFARLAAARPGSDVRETALNRIRGAMLEFPVATGGDARFSTVLMQAAQGRLVAKGGAEGLECVGVPARGLGVALKCEDGGTRAVAPAVVALLDKLGLLDAEALALLETWRAPVIKNVAGLEVGRLEPQLLELQPIAG